MRRILTLVLFLALLCSCSYSDNGYKKGFAEGYAAGYAAAIGELNNRSISDVMTEEHAIPTSAPPEKPTPNITSANDFTVYISRNGVMHKKSNCSGMKYYTEMPYSVASEYYTQKCSKCFK